MKKNFYSIFFCIFLCSCSSHLPSFKEGEYILTVHGSAVLDRYHDLDSSILVRPDSIFVYNDGKITSCMELSYPRILSIYSKKGKSYVQTTLVGEPLWNGVVPEYADYPLCSGHAYNHSTHNNISSNSRLFMENGLLICHNLQRYFFISSPIPVEVFSNGQIKLRDSEIFSTFITTNTGTNDYEACVQYVYGPIYVSGDKITWDVSLHFFFWDEYDIDFAQFDYHIEGIRK